jgi:hypothetical protein
VDIGSDNKRKGKYIVIHEFIDSTDAMQKEFEGSIVKRQQQNKAGRKLNTYDLFFESQGQSYFIKTCNGTVTRSELEGKAINDNSKDNKPFKVIAEIKNGLRDTDDPKQQSRIGKYICIYKVIN